MAIVTFESWQPSPYRATAYLALDSHSSNMVCFISTLIVPLHLPRGAFDDDHMRP